MSPEGTSRRLTDGPVAIDMQGMRVGPWLVGVQTYSRRSRAQWLCTCVACGSPRTLAGTDLRAMGRRGIQPCRRCGAGASVAVEGGDRG